MKNWYKLIRRWLPQNFTGIGGAGAVTLSPLILEESK